MVMEHQPRRWLNFTSYVGYLLLIILIYATFASKDTSSESWKNQRLESEGSTSKKMVAQSILATVEHQEFLLRRLVRGDERIQLESEGFSCHSDLLSDLCIVNKPVRIDTKALTVYIPSGSNQSQIQRMVKPYALHNDENAMQYVSPVQIIKGNVTSPACDLTHNVTAVIFSTGGFFENAFHEVDEIIIPLFITCHHFQLRLKFIITDYRSRWVQKYNRVLAQLSPYEAIDSTSDGKVHCFPGAVIGLKNHGILALNASDIPGGYSMSDFRHFIRESYNLKIKDVSEIRRPVLTLISRDKSRKFLNEDEMVKLMKELGYRVVVALPGMVSNLDKFAAVLNSCNVFVGAHGAGMTNELFLPHGAIVIQAVPLALEWASTAYYEEPTKKMGLKYLEYKTEPEESSLINKYARNDPVFTDPDSIIAKGYKPFRAIYLDSQDLNINLTRFRGILVEALRILGFSAPLNGRT